MSNPGYNSEAIVIDNGSGIYKVGFSGEDSPRLSIPTIIGISENNEIYNEEEKSNTYLGWGALEKKDTLKLVKPVERSRIVDWENMENMWKYTFEVELKNELEHQKLPLIISAPNKGFKKGRKQMLKILFESYDIPGLSIFSQSLLSMYSTGHVTGLVLEVGEGTTSCVPCFEGHIIPYAINQINMSGYDITKYIQYNLNNQYKINITDKQYEILQDIKEQMVYIYNVNKEVPNGLSSYGTEQYELPDGSIIDIPADIRYNASEILFNPKLYYDAMNNTNTNINIPTNISTNSSTSTNIPPNTNTVTNNINIKNDYRGINDIILDTLNKTDNELKNELISYIAISGGTSNIPGFHDRMRGEINKIINTNSSKSINVYADSQRKNSTWMGGSMIASMDMFKNIMITRQEYDEYGEDIIYRKHF